MHPTQATQPCASSPPLLPRSGMLPGYISGFYNYDEVHIDLSRLARFAGARLVHAEARGLDLGVSWIVGDG